MLTLTFFCSTIMAALEKVSCKIHIISFGWEQLNPLLITPPGTNNLHLVLYLKTFLSGHQFDCYNELQKKVTVVVFYESSIQKLVLLYDNSFNNGTEYTEI